MNKETQINNVFNNILKFYSVIEKKIIVLTFAHIICSAEIRNITGLYLLTVI